MRLTFDTFPTPLGNMTAVVANGKLCLLDFSDGSERSARILDRRFGVYQHTDAGVGAEVFKMTLDHGGYGKDASCDL